MSFFPQQPMNSRAHSINFANPINSQSDVHSQLSQQQTVPQPIIPSQPSPMSQSSIFHPSHAISHSTNPSPAGPLFRSPAPFSFPAMQPHAPLSPFPPLPAREAIAPDTPLPVMDAGDKLPADEPKPALDNKRLMARIGAFLVVPLLVGIFIFIWYSSPSSTTSGTVTQQNFTSSSSSPSSSSNSSGSSASSNNYSGTTGDIQVYIVGAIKHPGVYQLSSDARVYQLLQAAGGPLPQANLVAVNLAARLTDGEEVYITRIGEIPPTYMGGVPGPGSGSGTPGATGQLVNINTASVDEMRTALHVSSATAQSIVNYRTANGPFTSVDQLQQVVSTEIYNKIKNLVTV